MLMKMRQVSLISLFIFTCGVSFGAHCSEHRVASSNLTEYASLENLHLTNVTTAAWQIMTSLERAIEVRCGAQNKDAKSFYQKKNFMRYASLADSSQPTEDDVRFLLSVFLKQEDPTNSLIQSDSGCQTNAVEKSKMNGLLK